ncbi:MAG: hypothetical protein R3C28_02940 [Pirellulaceae bacterium]
MGLYLAIAFVPLGVYLALIGALNLAPIPFVTNGFRDSLTLSLGISGLVIAGPVELFLPENAASVFGSWIWGPLVVLYVLVSLLIALVSRPRIVVYNISPQQLRSPLSDLARKLDSSAKWAGDCLCLPERKIQLCMEANPPMRNTQLVAVNPAQLDEIAEWRHLEIELKRELANVQTGANRRGIGFLLTAATIALLVSMALLQSRQDLAQDTLDFLRW